MMDGIQLVEFFGRPCPLLRQAFHEEGALVVVLIVQVGNVLLRRGLCAFCTLYRILRPLHAAGQAGGALGLLPCQLGLITDPCCFLEDWVILIAAALAQHGDQVPFLLPLSAQLVDIDGLHRLLAILSSCLILIGVHGDIGRPLIASARLFIPSARCVARPCVDALRLTGLAVGVDGESLGVDGGPSAGRGRRCCAVGG